MDKKETNWQKNGGETIGKLNRNKRLKLTVKVFMGLLLAVYLLMDSFYIEEKYIEQQEVKAQVDLERTIGVDWLVIEGTKQGSSVNFLFEEKYSSDGFTMTTIKIDHIHINNTKIIVNENQMINVKEPYYTRDFVLKPGKQRVFKGAYTRMKRDNQYLLVLKWNEALAGYSIVHNERGKFNLNGKDIEELQATDENKIYKNHKDKLEQVLDLDIP